MTDAARDDAGALSRQVLDSQTDQTDADEELSVPR